MARLTSKPQPTRGRPEPASGGDTAARGQVIQVATRCATLDEFVERFAAFAWESSLVLPAASALPVGTQGRFVILLRDQTVAMRGRCRVTEAKPTPVSTRNPAVKRVMMRVALLEMDDASRAVHKRLIALRSAPVPLPIPPEPSETTQIEPARGGTAPGAAAPAAAPPKSAPGDAVVGPPPAADVPAPPVKTPPPAPPISVNRTMIGLGIGPDGKPVLKHPTPPAVPPVNMGTLGGSPNPPAMGRGEQSSPAPPAIAAGPPAPSSAAQALGTAATMIMTPGAPAPGAAPRVPTPPRVETRAPRAAETLPANPLSEFAADEVDSFIECTLLEAEDAPAGEAPDGPTSADAPLALAAAAVRRTTAYIRIQQLAAKLPPGVLSKLLRVGPYVGVGLICLLVGYLVHRPAAAPSAPASTTRAAVMPAPAPSPAPPAVAEPEAKAPPAEIAAPPAAAEKKVSAAERKLAAAEKRAAAAAESKAAAAESKAAAAESKAAAAENKAAAAAEKKAAAAANKVVAAEAAPPEEAQAAPKERPAAPVARPVVSAGTPGVCTARVTTEPTDAKVIWGDKEIGRSPIDGAQVPCGAVTVTIERERWQPVTVDVNMQSGDEAVVRQKLHRPHGTLVISSSPPGAQISVNRAPVGPAPKHLDAMRYEKVAIKASLKGYQPWSKNVYLREAETKIDIQLVSRR